MKHDHNPQYPTLPTVAKFRNNPNADSKAYGAAVRAAIRTLQRQELARACNGPTNPKSPCASRTWHSDGRKILAAVREQHKAALATALNGPTFARSAVELLQAYQDALAEKRALPLPLPLAA